MYKSFTAGQQSEFTKYADYHEDGKPYVDSLTIIDFPDDTARTNALLGGQVDVIDNLPAAQVQNVEANPNLRVLSSETGAWQPFTMRVDQAPFDDVRVRQAFRLIVDREQMVQQVLSGHGSVANDLYARYDPAYASDLPQRQQDLEQAKSLLKQAGREGLSVELVTAPVFQGIVEAAQVFAEQAKGAGVDVKVRRVDSGTFYGDNYLSWTFAQDFWATRVYLSQVAQGDLPESPFNETHWPPDDEVPRPDPAGPRRDRRGQAHGHPARGARRCSTRRAATSSRTSRTSSTRYSAKLGGFVEAKCGFPFGNYWLKNVGLPGVVGSGGGHEQADLAAAAARAADAVADLARRVRRGAGPAGRRRARRSSAGRRRRTGSPRCASSSTSTTRSSASTCSGSAAC